ncbi:hypothetical protein L218DRAFT_870279 [Marasmius fiardii PR-910]|nr:hypothetical protein L218DRAFT_870279 [Marasmius fiardii PR-910]
MKTLARTANIRHWLRRPDCPEAVKQLKRLFDKCFVPVNAPTEPQLPREVKGPERAHVSHLGVNYSQSRTHEGNATIFYRPTPDSTPPPIAGQIQSIENVRVGANTMIKLHVVPYKPLSKALYDPFVRYPHLDAKTYSSELASTEHVIGLDGIVSHAARFDFSRGRSVFLNLSRE